MLTVVSAILVSVVAAFAAFAKGRLRYNLSVIRSYRFRHFALNFPVIVLVATVWALLTRYVPFMDRNPILWFAFAAFGVGNGRGASLAAAGFQSEWYLLIYVPLLILAFPTFAKREELAFREGTPNWRWGTVRSVCFGLVHLIMLVPLGMALALSIGGMWFTRQYFKGGVERSTVYHATYNTTIFVIGFVLLELARVL